MGHWVPYLTSPLSLKVHTIELHIVQNTYTNTHTNTYANIFTNAHENTLTNTLPNTNTDTASYPSAHGSLGSISHLAHRCRLRP